MNKYTEQRYQHNREIYLLLKKHELSKKDYEELKDKKDFEKWNLEQRIKRVREICEARNIYKRNSPTFFKFLPNDLINDICKKNIPREVDRMFKNPSYPKFNVRSWKLGNTQTEKRREKLREWNEMDTSYLLYGGVNAGLIVQRRYKEIAKAKKNMRKLLDGITRIRMNKIISKQVLDKQNKQDIMSKNYVYDCIISMRQEHQREMIKWEIEQAEKHKYKYYNLHGHKWDYDWAGLPDNIYRMKSLCEKLVKAETKDEKLYYLLELSRLVDNHKMDLEWEQEDNYFSYNIHIILKHLLDRATYYEWGWSKLFTAEEDRKAILDMLEGLEKEQDEEYWFFVKDYFQLW